ncbi:MAG TPA: NAD+ synthase [Miltoncostaeaceae bacterium]|nr:NAD+ synthase [Miltoncostaeaceae bacterium]
MRIACAQINPIVGDIAGNGRRIGAAVARAADAGADLVLFPEFALTGFPLQDLLFDRDLLVGVERELERIAVDVGDPVVILGAPRLEGGQRVNAAVVLHAGRIRATYRQRRAAVGEPQDGARYFCAGEDDGLLVIGTTRVLIEVGADFLAPLSPAEGSVDLICWVSAEQYRRDRGGPREALLGERARRSGAAVAFCNRVGGQDDLVFDGRSTVVDRRGVALGRAPEFEEHLLLVDLPPRAIGERGGEDRPGSEPLWRLARPPVRERSPVAGDLHPPLGEEAAVWAALRLGLRDYVTKNGAPGVVLGLSGGIDSALCAALAVDALGSVAVTGIALPSRHSAPESLAGARALAEALDIELLVIPIEGPVASLEAALAGPLGADAPPVTWENLQARARGTLLMGYSNARGALLLATGNKSEAAVGYSTLYGDMAGGFAPLKDVDKTWVYRLARWHNATAGRELIPQETIDRPPTAELRPGQRDSDSLPPYDLLDALLADHIEGGLCASELVAAGHDPELVRRVLPMVDRAEFKRRQGPIGPTIGARCFGRDRPMPITAQHDLPSF